MRSEEQMIDACTHMYRKNLRGDGTAEEKHDEGDEELHFNRWSW